MINLPLNPQLFGHLFFAGRSRITLVNTNKGTHVRLKVKEKKERRNGKLEGTGRFYVFTSILNDGDTGWDFAGTMFKDSGNYRLGNAHAKGSQTDRILAFTAKAINNPSILDEKGVQLFHEGRCCRCGMGLTHPESITIGVGPDCVKHMPQSFFDSLLPAI